MTDFLVRVFIKDADDTDSPIVRERYGKLAGAVGICSNVLLVLLKLGIGFITGSISIMADAVNNLSDCASSAITLVAFKLAALPADEEHPYGHARFEYISGLVVSFLVLAIGFEFFVSSLRKVLAPEPVTFSWIVAGVLVLSILVKLWQGVFNKSIGTRIDSLALAATSADSMNDAISTGVVLLGLMISHFSGLYLDGWLGMAVSVLIVVSGVRLVIETLNPLLGAAPDTKMVEAIQDKIMTYDSVLGLHDLIVHNYGPGRCFASVHVEVPANQDIMVSHDIIDNIERDFSLDMNIELVIHLDPIITDDEHLASYREFMEKAVWEIDPVLSIHDFRMVEGQTHTNLIFDVVIPPRYTLSDDALRREIGRRAARLDRKCYCVVTVDRSYTSTRSRAKKDS